MWSGEEKPTGRLRFVKGVAGTLIPPNFGLEQEWLIISIGREVTKEWRPVEVVEAGAEAAQKGQV